MCKSHSNLFQDHLWHGHWIFEKARAIILKQLARIEKTMFSVPDHGDIFERLNKSDFMMRQSSWHIIFFFLIIQNRAISCFI